MALMSLVESLTVLLLLSFGFFIGFCCCCGCTRYDDI